MASDRYLLDTNILLRFKNTSDKDHAAAAAAIRKLLSSGAALHSCPWLQPQQLLTPIVSDPLYLGACLGSRMPQPRTMLARDAAAATIKVGV